MIVLTYNHVQKTIVHHQPAGYKITQRMFLSQCIKNISALLGSIGFISQFKKVRAMIVHHSFLPGLLNCDSATFYKCH